VDLEALSRYLPSVERTLAASYDARRRSAPLAVRPFVGLNRGFTLRGGKRFRALLVLAGYHLVTGRPPRAAIPAAAALEHFQSWMLIHDDIIDHSEVRRGGPTLHRDVARRQARIGGAATSDDFGAGVAITLGDLEEPWTWESLLQSRAPPARLLAAIGEVVRMTRLTAYGQLLDLCNGTREPSRVREADVLEVHRLKSAVYTVVSPMRIGAALAGGSSGLLADLEAIGTDLGIAFQLRDDVLGAGFEAGEIGKSANDLVEGKRTLLVVRAWSDGSPAERAALVRVLGRSTSTAAEIARARRAIRSSGSLRYSEEMIEQLTERALGRLARSRTIAPKRKPLLVEVAYRLTRRSV
jgi:geranylgeranyl diphosphate synthase, type I